jgi:hypothetical protein
MIEQHEVVSVVALSVVAALSTVAIFCRNYHENWLQFLGLVGIALWAAARVSQLVDMMSTRLPAQGMILHVSMALFAVGTAMKVWAHRPRDNEAAPPAPYKLDPHDMRRVAGGKQ